MVNFEAKTDFNFDSFSKYVTKNNIEELCDQFENANYYKNLDCCWLLEQSKFEDTIEALLEEILNKECIDYPNQEDCLVCCN